MKPAQTVRWWDFMVLWLVPAAAQHHSTVCSLPLPTSGMRERTGNKVEPMD